MSKMKEETVKKSDEEVIEVEEELEQVENTDENSIENEDVEIIEEKDVNELGKKAEIKKLEENIQDLQNKLLRAQADFENYRKRTTAEKTDLMKYGNSKLIASLLPTYDNFDRAIQASKENNDFQSLVDGVEIVYRQLEEILKAEGLEEMDAVGKPFDPEFHQAVMQVESEEYDSNTVVEELQKGYTLKGKVVRPAMVKVSV